MIDAKMLAKAADGSKAEGLTIQKQISLPWKDAFRISIRNVTLRLGRAAITGAGVVLGIAFLVSVWTGKVITEGLEKSKSGDPNAIAAMAGSAKSQVEAEKQEQEMQRKAREGWLVVMSLLVCGVGITNSMLMSVTERFREIGTMKCLGAKDSFIVRLFLIESLVLGFLGSLVGVLVGHLIMLIIYMLKEGVSVPAKMNWAEMLAYMGLSMSIGCILAFFAAVAPAMRAAQMPAAAALATEV